MPLTAATLGAGFLLTASIISTLSTLVLTYLLVFDGYEGVFSGLEKYAPQMLYVDAQFAFVTVFLWAATYFALNRIRWGTVMVACLFGSLLVITIPFTIPAFFLIGISKYHFTLRTPSKYLDRG